MNNVDLTIPSLAKLEETHTRQVAATHLEIGQVCRFKNGRNGPWYAGIRVLPADYPEVEIDDYPILLLGRNDAVGSAMAYCPVHPNKRVFIYQELPSIPLHELHTGDLFATVDFGVEITLRVENDTPDEETGKISVRVISTEEYVSAYKVDDLKAFFQNKEVYLA